MTAFPPVPLTVEGSYVLHQVFAFDWAAWNNTSMEDRKRIGDEAARALQELEPQQSALYSTLGHKGDLLLVHFRDSIAALNAIELKLAQIGLSRFLKATYSYLSVVELSLYESSRKTYAMLAENGLEQFSPAWNAGIREVLERQKEAMAQRLIPTIPPARHLCFYPMNRKRGEERNWYALPLDERQRLMHDHGMIGRRYADRVRQIISASIGFDDWEWSVDLFADDPLVFKHLIYEMRFDEASSLYAEFGPFYVGVRVAADGLDSWLRGDSA